MQLNEALDAAQSLSIQTNAESIATESAARIDADNTLQSLLSQEETARIAGDTALQSALNSAISSQNAINSTVNSQLTSINSQIVNISGLISSLQNSLTQVNANLDSIESSILGLNQDLSLLNLRIGSLEGSVESLTDDLIALQDQVNQQGVKVFKCNSPSSSERMFQINGKFYAAMNRVTTQSIQTVTGSSSQSFTTPSMCQTSTGQLELPNNGGICTPVSGPNASISIPGQTINVPSYSTANVTVVTSVRIALDLLVDGGYITTDGGPNCSFSISNGGTVSSNLIQVQ
jgi:archaellum component FlaC